MVALTNLKRIMLVTALLPALAAAQLFDSTRIGSQNWEARQTDGTRISGHQSEATAAEACAKWSLDHELADCDTVHTGTRWTATRALHKLLEDNDTGATLDGLLIGIDAECVPDLHITAPFAFDLLRCSYGSELTADSFRLMALNGESVGDWTVTTTLDGIGNVASAVLANPATIAGTGDLCILIVGESGQVVLAREWSVP
jgi:hypothetical protein